MDVIVLSCVRAGRPGGGGGKSLGFLDDVRRINVAITRARCAPAGPVISSGGAGGAGSKSLGMCLCQRFSALAWVTRPVPCPWQPKRNFAASSIQTSQLTSDGRQEVHEMIICSPWPEQVPGGSRAHGCASRLACVVLCAWSPGRTQPRHACSCLLQRSLRRCGDRASCQAQASAARAQLLHSVRPLPAGAWRQGPCGVPHIRHTLKESGAPARAMRGRRRQARVWLACWPRVSDISCRACSRLVCPTAEAISSLSSLLCPSSSCRARPAA